MIFKVEGFEKRASFWTGIVSEEQESYTMGENGSHPKRDIREALSLKEDHVLTGVKLVNKWVKRLLIIANCDC
jgi:hypothetical protein